MALYTFYPCTISGTASTFDALELADDAEAIRHTGAILDEHMSADFVVVWCGDRRVFTRQRVHPVLHALLSREVSPSR
jgi:hypothetical protein